jgi:hypothetical protein
VPLSLLCTACESFVDWRDVWQEYVNEDLTVMKKELQQWKEEYAKRNDV